jgi:hypothetical protein
MNELQEFKWSKEVLMYSLHAQERAYERGVPMPKYLPLDSRRVHNPESIAGERYKILFNYNDEEYFLILSKDFTVVTVYPTNETNEIRQCESRVGNLKVYKNNKQVIQELWAKVDKMVLFDDYICLESEVYSKENFA